METKILSDKYKQNSASEQLVRIRSIQQKVVQEAAKDYLVFFGWGLYSLLLIPVFDYINPNIWGPAIWLISIVGTIVTWRYYAKRHTRVKLANKVGWKVWFALGIWSAASSLFTILAIGHIAYPYTIGGIALALPILAYGVWLFKKYNNEKSTTLQT